MEATQNICWVKDEGAVHDSTVARLFKKFYLSCKDLNNQARWDSLKPLFPRPCSKTDTNLANRTWIVSGKIGILLASSGNSLLQTQQEHLELLNCASHYQNIIQL